MGVFLHTQIHIDTPYKQTNNTNLVFDSVLATN